MGTDEFRKWVEQFFFSLLDATSLARFELTLDIYRKDLRDIRLASDFCDASAAMRDAAMRVGIRPDQVAWDAGWESLTEGDVLDLMRPAVMGVHRNMGDLELVGRARLTAQRPGSENYALGVLRDRFGCSDVRHVLEEIRLRRRPAPGGLPDKTPIGATGDLLAGVS